MKFKEYILKNGKLTGLALTGIVVCLLTLVLITTNAFAPAETEQAANQPARLARGTMLTLNTTYSTCGHSSEKAEALVCKGDSVSRAELESLYPDWQVTTFSADGATLSRTLATPCEKHCLIKLTDTRLTISRLADGVMKEIGSASIERETIDTETLAKLESGCLTDTLAQAEAYIEDIES